MANGAMMVNPYPPETPPPRPAPAASAPPAPARAPAPALYPGSGWGSTIPTSWAPDQRAVAGLPHAVQLAQEKALSTLKNPNAEQAAREYNLDRALGLPVGPGTDPGQKPVPGVAGTPPAPPAPWGNSAYNAPMPKGSTTTTPQLSPSQLTIWGQGILPNAQQYAGSNLTIPSSMELVAPHTYNEDAGLAQLATQAVPGMEAAATHANDFLNWMTNPTAINSLSNPILAGAESAADQPIINTLTKSTLPQIETGAAAAGQYGSSREGIAQGYASEAASQAESDTNAKIAEAAYQTNMDAMTKALGLAPSIQQMQAAPGELQYAVGAVNQQQQQAVDSANLERMLYNMNVPLMKAQNLAGISGSQGTGTVSSAPTNTSLLQAILGGAGIGTSIGAGLGSVIPGVGTALGGGAGALAGGGLGALLAELG